MTTQATPSSTATALAHAIGAVDEAALTSLLDADVRWLQVGRQPVVGRDAVLKVLRRSGAASSLKVNHVVSEGQRTVVDGEAVLGGKPRGFCHIAELSDDGMRVCVLTTYLVTA
jgi:hypothetical protein